jgi:hypothetical protein
MKKDGWDGYEEAENQQWSFSGALFYSIIVITTIGEWKFMLYCVELNLFLVFPVQLFFRI